MKKHCPSILLSFSALLLMLSGCQALQEGRRNELEYHALIVSEQAETPALEPEVNEDSAEVAPRRGFFSRVFGQSDPQVEPPTDEIRAPGPQQGDPATPPVAQPMAQPMDQAQAVAEGDAMAANRLQSGEPIIVVISGTTMDDRVEANIDERGFIKLRYIGSVRAAGRTPTELAREIEAEYTDRQQIFREVYVTVHVPNRYYFIGGEIRQAGRYPLVGRVTLSQAIVAAGNFTEWARNDGRLTLLRDNERTTINFRDITNDPNLDVELRPGDVITVDRRGF
ncbi:MAG: polysaccharide biosynthesis/export family protein [Verrucomicrobia bacterium]|nr:polysaccharide biosynthesis/export family protein [Verrucomicrobiota bacterium]MCH8512958.1 polysaccharide biosynthesis/export family protein [Kiritimatiellia bacterium]